MLLPNEIFRNSIFSLTKLDEFFTRVLDGKAKIERPDITFFNLDNAFYDIKNALTEMNTNSSSKNDVVLPDIYLSVFDDYFEAYQREKATGENNLEKYKEIIAKIKSNLDLDDILKNRYINKYHIPWSIRNIIAADDDNDILDDYRVIDKLFSMVNFKDRKTNTLVVTKNNMRAFENVHNKYTNNTIYSVHDIMESDRMLCGEKYTDRYIYGGLRGAKITNNAFDIVLVKPRIILSYEGSIMKMVKSEYYDLEHAFNYAAAGAFVVFTLPYFRFYRDIASLVSKNLENVNIYEFYDKNQYHVIVAGQKKAETKEIDKDIYGRLRNLPNDYRSLKNILYAEDNSYNMPEEFSEIKMFRGSVMVEAELDNMFSLTSSTKDFWNDQDVKTLANDERHPLLPFNNGQIGIILTSGCLDGVVDEGDGYCHLIKGRIIKVTDSTTEVDEKNEQTIQSEVVSNRVEINAFLPDGTFKRLA